MNSTDSTAHATTDAPAAHAPHPGAPIVLAFSGGLDTSFCVP